MGRFSSDEFVGQAQRGSPQGVEVLCDAGQGRGRPTCQGNVVEADDGDVVGDPYAGGEQLMAQSQGDIVVTGEDGIGQAVFEHLLGMKAVLSVVVEFAGGLVFLWLVLKKRAV